MPKGRGPDSLLFLDITKKHHDDLQALYWSIRAYAAETPFPCRQGIADFFEFLQEKYLDSKKPENAELKVNASQDLTPFLLPFFRLQSILFNHSGIKQVQPLREMFSSLSKYLARVQDDRDTNTQKESSILGHVILITIFGLYNTIEGYSDDKKFDIKKLKKSIPQMESDDFMRECLTFSYAILSKVMEVLINVEDENYTNLFLPVLYYLHVYKNQSKFFFENFKPFNYIMNKVLQLTQERLSRKFQYTEDELKTAIKTKLLNYESILVGKPSLISGGRRVEREGE